MFLRLPPEEYKLLCRKVMDRDGWRCRNPRCLYRNNLSVHHIQFRSEGGDDASYNLVTLCTFCHTLVHNYKLFIGCAEGNHIGVGGGADGKLIFTKGEKSR